MSSSTEKHRPPPGGGPRQFEAKNHLPANRLTPINELSALIEAFHSFAPEIFEVHFPEQNCNRSIEIGSEVHLPEQSCTRSIEIGSVEVWELFVATLRPETTAQQNAKAQVLYNFIENKLRFWIDFHPRDRRCLLHLKMPIGLPHELCLETFTTSARKRLDALPSLFPQNFDYLNALRAQILDTRSSSWRRLSNKMPDSTFTFDAATYEFPGFIIEVGDSQNWERDEGVKNKAAQYEDDSGGMIAGVLYLGYGDRSIAMIGSKTVFPSSPPVKYLDGTPSSHAVEVIPLTSLTDPAYSECLLILKFAYFGAGQVLLPSLEPDEREMGFFFTFKEILQMMETVANIVASSPLPLDAAGRFDPLTRQRPWDSNTAIQASIFRTPPNSPPYCPAQASIEEPAEDLSVDEVSDEQNSGSSDSSAYQEQTNVNSTCLRRSAWLNPA